MFMKEGAGRGLTDSIGLARYVKGTDGHHWVVRAMLRLLNLPQGRGTMSPEDCRL